MEAEDRAGKAREMALFRFSVVAPVVQGLHPDASAAAYCRRVSEKPLKRPDGTEFLYSPASLMRWIAWYKKGGLDALAQKGRSDRGSTRALSGECRAEIHAVRQKFPRLNAVQIRLHLVREGLVAPGVSVRTVQRYVKAHAPAMGQPGGVAKERRAYEEERFGDMWLADTCYFPYITENGKKRRTYLVAIVDDHSRMCVGAGLFYEDSAYSFQTVLKRAVAAYGIPSKLYCDNGSAYRNSQLRFICAEIGTSLIHTPVRDGAAKGKVERMFRTFKERWLYGLDMDGIGSLEAFNAALLEHARQHNLTPNSSTGQAPMERFLATGGGIRVPESPEWLDLRFMNRVRRKVRGDCTLSIGGALFDAPMEFAGQTVEVRFLPDRMDEAFIFEGGIQRPLRRTDKAANARAKRKGPSIDYSKGGGDGV
jgi:transposase InsO family protein